MRIMATKAQTNEEKLEQRGNELMSQMTNKHKREAVKFFDCNFDELDGLDQMVLMASIADPSKTLEELDGMPFGDLQKVVLGE